MLNIRKVSSLQLGLIARKMNRILPEPRRRIIDHIQRKIKGPISFHHICMSMRNSTYSFHCFICIFLFVSSFSSPFFSHVHYNYSRLDANIRVTVIQAPFGVLSTWLQASERPNKMIRHEKYHKYSYITSRNTYHHRHKHTIILQCT